MIRAYAAGGRSGRGTVGGATPTPSNQAAVNASNQRRQQAARNRRGRSGVATGRTRG